MKISLSWLRDYVPIEMEVDQLAEALTMVGLEVSSVSDRYDYLGSVVVGRIAKITPHLKSDHLKICHVNLGERLISVVCGAPNVAEGMLAPVALPGTVFPDGAVLKKVSFEGKNQKACFAVKRSWNWAKTVTESWNSAAASLSESASQKRLISQIR